MAGLLSLIGVVASPPAVLASGGEDPSTIAAGVSHSCGVTTTGGAMCWGVNTNGQLGNNSTTASSAPVQVNGLTAGVTAVATSAPTGGGHSCAVVSGAAKCWGLNGNGQLGNNSGTQSLVPVQVQGLTSGVTAIATGTTHSCAVVSGAAKCWGINSNGQLGNGSSTQSLVPVQVTGLTSGVTAIATGADHSCAVQSGAAVCWGYNGNGRLGNGTSTASNVPVQVSGLTSGVTSISAGGSHSCATVSGSAMCWGINTLGMLGNNSTTQSLTPVQVQGLTSGVTVISAGASSSCAVVSGAAKCWGDGGLGRLGNNATTQSNVPVQVAGLTSGVSAISVGNSHACAVASNVAKCWGGQNTVLLGDGVTTSAGVTTAAAVVEGLGVPSSVATGAGHSCAVVSGGAWCWGANGSGQLGNGGTTTSAVPVAVTGLSSGVTAIGAGNSFTCAIQSGAVKCWGLGTTGQLGNGLSTSSPTPVQVTGLTSGVTALTVSSNGLHTCALVSDAMKCWGANNHGQLGNGANATAPSPVQPTGMGSGVSSIAAGSGHTCALMSGSAKCWGNGGNGRLGNGGTTSSNVPVQVSGLTSGVSSIAAGGFHTCAALTAGTARCWGWNNNGQIGNNALIDATTPAVVSGLTSGVTAVAVGDSHSCAIVSGAVNCWGINAIGQLGDGTTTRSLVPKEVPRLTSGISLLAAGYAHSCAASSNTTWCWGNNPTSQVSFTALAPRSVLGGAVFGQAANTAPVAAGQSVSAPRGVGTQIVLAATDAEDDELTYAVETGPSKGTLDCNGSFGEDCLYTAGPGQTGSDSFTFSANDGTVDSNTATVNITITNQAPVADAVSASAPRGVATEVVLTGSDPNGDPFTFAKVTDPTKGSVTCNGAGVCSYTADPGTSGTDSFTFTTSDGVLTSVAGTVTITITNQAPSADDHAFDAGRGVATPVVLSGADPNGDSLTYEIVSPPTKGTVDCVPAGSATCTYTSTPSETGSDSFTYRTTDGSLTSPPATVAITLVNAGPTANDQGLEAARGVATPIVLSGADGEGDDLTFAVVDPPTKGSLACGGPAGAVCSYTADAGETGTDTFTFTASDGTDTSAVGTVTITITNQAPVANAQTVAGNAPTVATPITLTASDPNSDTITYAPTSSPTKGSLDCVGDACTYTASAGKTGTDSFTFSATDIGGLSHTATVTVNLDGATPGVYVGEVDFVEPESGNASFRSPFIPVTLTTASPQAVTVWYHTVDGTAVANGMSGDYREWGTPSSPRSITIPAGQTTGWIQPPVLDDNDVEGTEHFDVVISSTSGGAAYRGDSTTRVNIIDADTISDGRPILSLLDVGQAEGNVGTRAFGFRAVLSKPATTQVKLTCAPTAGSATAGSDFRAGSKTVTINPGSMSVSIDVLGYSNTADQADRSFTLDCVLVGSPDVLVQGDTSATGAIADED